MEAYLFIGTTLSVNIFLESATCLRQVYQFLHLLARVDTMLQHSDELIKENPERLIFK
jgi:hypothetical protein